MTDIDTERRIREEAIRRDDAFRQHFGQAWFNFWAFLAALLIAHWLTRYY